MNDSDRFFEEDMNRWLALDFLNWKRDKENNKWIERNKKDSYIILPDIFDMSLGKEDFFTPTGFKYVKDHCIEYKMFFDILYDPERDLFMVSLDKETTHYNLIETIAFYKALYYKFGPDHKELQ